MVTRWSASEIRSLAVDAERSGKLRVILLLGDYYPSGRIMLAHIVQRARDYAPNARFHCEQVVLTREQVSLYKLPTRPATTWRGGIVEESVELDALYPHILQKLLKEAIEQHIDQQAWATMTEVEESERSILLRMAEATP
jgi:hypothetical protein